MSIWKISTLWQSRDLPSLRRPLYYSFCCFLLLWTGLGLRNTKFWNYSKEDKNENNENCKMANIRVSTFWAFSCSGVHSSEFLGLVLFALSCFWRFLNLSCSIYTNSVLLSKNNKQARKYDTFCIFEATKPPEQFRRALRAPPTSFPVFYEFWNVLGL